MRRRHFGAAVALLGPATVGALAALPARVSAAPRREADRLLLHGEVVAVIDGDTLGVLDGEHEPQRVRLAGIDAPEHDQPGGAAAKAWLVQQVFRRQVLVAAYKLDRWNRWIGRVWLDGRDINLALVEQGLAWHDREHLREQSAADRQRYAQAEDEARAAGRGLWADPQALPPALFRRLRQIDRELPP